MKFSFGPLKWMSPVHFHSIVIDKILIFFYFQRNNWKKINILRNLMFIHSVY